LRRLVAAAIIASVSVNDNEHRDDIAIRRDLRPGDLGAIIEMHGRLYAAEYGNDSSFEGFVASSVSRAAIRGFPGEREGIWIVERDGELAGSIAYTDEGEETATLRWVLLDPQLRGRGLAAGLVAKLLDEVEEHGYERICLETFSDLRAAAHIYRSHGFEVVQEETGPRWGRERVTFQHYELLLPRSGRENPLGQSSSTTAPPRRGSPPPSSAPLSGSRATA
jgi:N-acetylglutamate synthase-like GNAT family acetyltransferase